MSFRSSDANTELDYCRVRQFQDQVDLVFRADTILLVRSSVTAPLNYDTSRFKEDSESDVRSLLEQGAEPGTSEAIHYAAARGSSRIVQALIDAGVDVDTPNSVGQTPLQCAARNGCVDVVRQLLKNNAYVNARDENDQTALHGAAAHGHESIVMMLLDAQADVFAEDADGQIALHFAARRHHNIVQALLESRSEQISHR